LNHILITMAELTSSGEVIRFGIFELDLSIGELRKRGTRLPIQGLPLQILAILAAKPGTVVTRAELRDLLWPADTFVDFDHSIRNAIARLREALDDSADKPRYIETLPRRGYRFIGHIDALPKADVAPVQVEPAVQPPRRARRLSATAIALVALAIIGSGALIYIGLRHRTAPQPIRSLAVLPLKNLSGDASQDYLADGVTEDLIGRLARIHDLRVISRTSSMHFKDTQLSVPEIANTLHVDAIVEGSLIREGSRIRVHAQLIRASTDEHLWAESYDRDLQDALALESEVAQAIAAKVEVTLTGEEHKQLAAARHVSPEVYESYLKGKSIKADDQAALDQSIAYFQDAINKDPTFAPAYLGLAEAYTNLGTVFVGAPPNEVRPKEISAARKALELDPDLVEAHISLAGSYQREWRWKDAEREYKQALAINPNDAAANGRFALWLLCQGRTDEALTSAQRGRELDPLAVSGVEIGWILFHARHYDDALRELRSVEAVRPDNAAALWNIGFVLIAQGKAAEAIPVLEKTVSLMHRSPGSLELLATAYAHAGRRAEALRLLNELKQRGRKSYVPAGAFINPYLGLRDYDEAFAWFERAYQEHSNILQFLKVHPFFDPIRDDPRFKDLVRRVGLE
jgi:TolB-like protein/DNA-binding winged helix-turn-helix (wHTH) protein